MNMQIDKARLITARIAPVIREMVSEEVESLRGQMLSSDAEIMKACRHVAEAYDALMQAKFSGIREVPARTGLERAAKTLERAMRKHGRMP